MKNSFLKEPYVLGQIFIFLSAILVRLIFWRVTNWAIEDGLIIARMVRNLTQFGEFSFNIGQKVSSSTSPIFALLSAAVSLTGIPPLASAKLLGVITSSLTAVLIFRILYQVNKSSFNGFYRETYCTISAISGSLIYVLFPPIIAYSVSGLETPFYAFLCCLTLYFLVKHKDRRARIYAVWSSTFAAMFRPDGVIILFLTFFVILMDENWRIKNTLLIFLPSLILIPLGILLHQLYFGAPLPQSLVAKASGYSVDILKNATKYLNRMLFAQQGSFIFYILSTFGFFWIKKKIPTLSVFILWYIVYHVIFILRAPLFDWYLQVPLFVLCLFSAIGIIAISNAIINITTKHSFTIVINPVMGFSLSIVLIYSLLLYTQGRVDGQLYETTVRAAAGTWLSNNTKEESLAFTESLGYIGYYSHNNFIDWPGLASPQVPILLVKHGVQEDRKESYNLIISTFRPEYLVLRLSEWDDLNIKIKNDYQICKTFYPPSNNTNPGYLVAGNICP